MDLYQWDAPVGEINGVVITRSDVLWTIRLLSVASFIAGFIVIVKSRLKRKTGEGGEV